MKRTRIHCPYCGSLAVLRPARGVYGDRPESKDTWLYMCRRWPACDAYVKAHPGGSHRPMGRLANETVRRKRVQAHQALDAVQQHWGLDREGVYAWLQNELGLPASEVHIAMFGEYRCDQVIRLCRQAAVPHAPRPS